MSKKNWLDNRIKDIESWGILSLMTELKEFIDIHYSNQESVLICNPGLDIEYIGSPLHCLRKEKEAIDKVYKNHFDRLYKELEEKEKK